MISNEELKQTINIIVEKIKNEYKPEKIILFGSYAYGRPNEDSDIDLLIIKNTSERPIDRRVAVRKLVSDPSRLVAFEPIVLTPQEIQRRLDIGDQFFQEIIEKGNVLYDRQ